MKKSGWMLLLVLLCVAFLVSCGKRKPEETEKGELVRSEAVGEFRQPLFNNGEFPWKSLTEMKQIGII